MAVYRSVAAPENAAHAAWVQLEIAKRTQAKYGFVLRPDRWVVGKIFSWTDRFWQLGEDHERATQTLARPHYLAFPIFMLIKLIQITDSKVSNTF